MLKNQRIKLLPMSADPDQNSNNCNCTIGSLATYIEDHPHLEDLESFIGFKEALEARLGIEVPFVAAGVLYALNRPEDFKDFYRHYAPDCCPESNENRCSGDPRDVFVELKFPEFYLMPEQSIVRQFS